MDPERSPNRYRALLRRWESSYEFQLGSEIVDELEDAFKHRYPEFVAVETFQSSRCTTIVLQKGRSGIRIDFIRNESQVAVQVNPFVQHILHPATVVLTSIVVLTAGTILVNLLPIPFWLGFVFSIYFSLLTPMICGSVDGIRGRRDGSFPTGEEIQEVGEFTHRFITTRTQTD